MAPDRLPGLVEREAVLSHGHTALSATCASRLEELLRRTGRNVRLTEVRGRTEDYWTVRLEDEDLEFYVYIDGAGIKKAGNKRDSWIPFEWPDYRDIERLCEAFLARAAAELEQGRR